MNKYKIELDSIETRLRNMKAAYGDEVENWPQDKQDEVGALLDRADELDEKLGNDNGVRNKILPIPNTRRVTTGPYNSFGEFLSDVIRAGSPNMTPSRKLAEWEKRAASGLSEGIGADGGFLVQTDYSSDLLRAAFDTGKIAKLCRKYRISGNSNSIKIPGVDETSRASTRWGGILHYWADEAAEKTKSKPKFRRIELNLNKMIGLCYATDELLQDAAALETYVRQGFAEEFAFGMDDAIINGTGAGRPLGILNGGSTIQVNKETGQAAQTVVWDNIAKMYARCINVQNAVWVINPDVLPELFNMYLAVGTGGDALFTANAQDDPRMRMLGLPIITCENAQTLGTAGDILLCNFKDGYVIADKGGTQVDMSIHVRFIYDESVFRFVYRVDGQPILASAITPQRSSDTVSHFVKLQTRS